MFPTRLSNKLRNLVGGETEAQVENIAGEATTRILNAAKEAGVNIYNFTPDARANGAPQVMTVRQYRIVTAAIARELNLSNRMNSMIETTNKGKKRLKKDIEAQKVLHGNEVLQYYAH